MFGFFETPRTEVTIKFRNGRTGKNVVDDTRVVGNAYILYLRKDDGKMHTEIYPLDTISYAEEVDAE